MACQPSIHAGCEMELAVWQRIKHKQLGVADTHFEVQLPRHSPPTLSTTCSMKHDI